MRVVVESPRGTRTNYESGDAGVAVDRAFRSTVHYPGDYGYVPDTRAGDGDPLDALVLVADPTVPGCIVEARPVALLRMTDTGERDDKVVAVPSADPRLAHVRDADDLSRQRRAEIAEFFERYAALEPGKETETHGFEDRETALAAVDDARR